MMPFQCEQCTDVAMLSMAKCHSEPQITTIVEILIGDAAVPYGTRVIVQQAGSSYCWRVWMMQCS
jgi:hypothetical protein